MSLELANYGKKVDEELQKMIYSSHTIHKTAIDGERLQNALRQFFPSSAGTKEVELRTHMEEYIKYKKSYVKHLEFDPDLKNLSKL